jgi:hypothetical protein
VARRRAGIASQATAQTNQCHDITVYPEIGLAAGACSGNGILLDISDPQNPTRVSDIFDPDMAYWHSATFNNAGDKVVFTDEWGGGTAARCRAEDPLDLGRQHGRHHREPHPARPRLPQAALGPGRRPRTASPTTA